MKFTPLLLSLLLQPITASWANPYVEGMIGQLNAQITLLQAIRAPQAGDENYGDCTARYDEIYSSETAEISLNLGYYDSPADDYVWDPWTAEALGIVLQRPCGQFNSAPGACGFIRTASDMQKKIYEKQLQTHLGSVKKVRLTINSSAITVRNSINISDTGNVGMQRLFTSNARNYFNESIQTGQSIVLYYGHSRHGRGPDFGPLAFNPSASDRNWQEVLASFRTAKKRGRLPRVFGLFSCDSLDHYQSDITQLSPHTGLILNNGVPNPADNFNGLFSSLDSLLKERCQGGFRQSLQKSPRARIYNFFPDRR